MRRQTELNTGEFDHLRARSGRVRGKVHRVEVMDPESVVPWRHKSLCGFKPARYWQPTTQWERTSDPCEECGRRAKERG